MTADRPPETSAAPGRGAWLRWQAQVTLGANRNAQRLVLIDRYTIKERGRPHLGIVGQTWAEHGAAYWARRAAWSAAQFLLWACFTGLFAGLLTALWRAGWPWPAPLALTTVCGITAVVGFLRMWWKLDVYGFQPVTAGAWRAQSTSYASARLLAPVLLPLWLPLIAGMLTAMFTSTLRRTFPGEGPARAALHDYEAHHHRARPGKPKPRT
jgi:hypothetical protein